jgi:hypothetical protein
VDSTKQCPGELSKIARRVSARRGGEPDCVAGVSAKESCLVADWIWQHPSRNKIICNPRGKRIFSGGDEDLELRNSGKEGRDKSHAAVAEERKGHSGFRFERSEKAWDALAIILKSIRTGFTGLNRIDERLM